jgi:hypothetical protein
MAATTTGTGPFRPREKVVATRDVGPVPEGTLGVVKIATGLTWPRYWVAWDGDYRRWAGSVSESFLVRADEWEDFKRRREEERNRPPEPATASTSASAGEAAGDGAASAAAAGGAASKVPAHLLERSRAARERRAATGG